MYVQFLSIVIPSFTSYLLPNRHKEHLECYFRVAAEVYAQQLNLYNFQQARLLHQHQDSMKIVIAVSG